jgi:hypothetical protein
MQAEGAQYGATVTQAIRWTLDTKAVRAECGDDWFNSRCRQSVVTTVTVAALASSQKLAA